MAEAQLNFDEAALDKSGNLFVLYDRLYQGMQKANVVDAPTYPSADDLLIRDSEGNISFDTDGNPELNSTKIAEVKTISSRYSDILMKNSAYLFANSIVSILEPGSGGGGDSGVTGFVSRAGDTMKGALSAWYGFDAGVNGQKIFEVSIDANDNKWSVINGGLKVNERAEINGLLALTQGIEFEGNRTIYLDNSALTIERQDINLKGDVAIDGTFTLGNTTINDKGIFWNDHEFYHSGNANKSDVNWEMFNCEMHGSLHTYGEIEVEKRLFAYGGFWLCADDGAKELLYSGENDDVYSVILNGDLKIINDNGIKFEENYIVNVRNKNTVSFSAPGMIMNLGDSDNDKKTSKISLQSDIWDYTNSFKIISEEGAGYFPNGLKANCSVNGSSVLETYRSNDYDLGVLFHQQISFGTTDGPKIYQDVGTLGFEFLYPYQNGGKEMAIETGVLDTYFAQTTSPFRDQSNEWSASFHFFMDGEFFSFDQPVESDFFAIKSDQYHTRLTENALFFDDGKFIEGVTDGLRYAGNGYFNGNISSPNFTSGFAGYGWAVKDELTTGGIHATFDTLTIRKKMRVYELEVQKTSFTNGSLWVSDYCSGDEVIALN